MELGIPGYRCFEGSCAGELNPKVYQNQQGLRQHQRKRHIRTKEEDTSMGRTLALKRLHEAEVEETRKRRLLEEEMDRHTPEPEPPRPVGFEVILTNATLGVTNRQQKHRSLSWRDQLIQGSCGRQEAGGSLHDSRTTSQPQRHQPTWGVRFSPKSNGWKQQEARLSLSLSSSLSRQSRSCPTPLQVRSPPSRTRLGCSGDTHRSLHITPRTLTPSQTSLPLCLVWPLHAQQLPSQSVLI